MSTPTPSVLAALDIGTNSFHLVVARHPGGDGFVVITRVKEVVRLGHGGTDMKELAPEATVVGAFHNVSAVGLWEEPGYLDEDVIVVGDVVEAKEVAMALAESVTGRVGIDGGKLRLARQLEPFTAVLISINRKYKVHSGLRITGLSLPH